MSFKAIYTCDICHEDTLKGNIRGCRFSDLRQFTLSEPEATQGTHICIACLDQLRIQLIGTTGLTFHSPTPAESK